MVAAWVAAAKNLRRPGISATANHWKREAGGRLLILAFLPSFLPVLGLSVSLLTLDREADTGALQPAAVAYGVLHRSLVWESPWFILVASKSRWGRGKVLAASFPWPPPRCPHASLARGRR